VIDMLFELGDIVATPGALATLMASGERPSKYLDKHAAGDYGTLCKEDVRENQRSIKHGGRIMSTYTLDNGRKIWIITEADRSVTTLLLPEEY
jgi:hypothetical protein